MYKANQPSVSEVEMVKWNQILIQHTFPQVPLPILMVRTEGIHFLTVLKPQKQENEERRHPEKWWAPFYPNV